ncbi:MAG: ACT domain-containing protein [Oscillospiraceae bacterium]|jgi:aspartokinase|nr:ACT domain-containing protein [Oscillospiraceae bacterium]
MNGVSRISLLEDVSLVTFHQIPSDLIFLSEVLEEFSDAKINIDMISQSAPTGGQVSVSFTVPSADLPQVLTVIGQIRKKYPAAKPFVSSGNSKIALYGPEMKEMYGVASAAIRAVTASGAEVTMITTSEMDISLLMTDFHLDDALAALEKAFGVRCAKA